MFKFYLLLSYAHGPSSFLNLPSRWKADSEPFEWRLRADHQCARSVRVIQSGSRTYSAVFRKDEPGCSCPTGRTMSGGWLDGRDTASERVENDLVKNEEQVVCNI